MLNINRWANLPKWQQIPLKGSCFGEYIIRIWWAFCGYNAKKKHLRPNDELYEYERKKNFSHLLHVIKDEKNMFNWMHANRRTLHRSSFYTYIRWVYASRLLRPSTNITQTDLLSRQTSYDHQQRNYAYLLNYYSSVVLPFDGIRENNNEL